MNAQSPSLIFERWLREHKGVLFKVVNASVETPEDREDLFQEIALQLWQSVPKFRGECKETTWIFRVALNTAAVWRRKERRRRAPLTAWDDTVRAVPAPSSSCDDRLEWLYAQLRRLDAVDRSLALLALEGFSYREIAEQLGITENHVGVKLNRLKRKLTEQAKSAHEFR